MYSDLSNISESIEFSESESSARELSISIMSIDIESSFSITKVHNKHKIKIKDTEMFLINNPFIITITDVQYSPGKYMLRPTFYRKLASNTDMVDESFKEITIHKFNPYIYEIQLEHGPFSWTIYRRYIDFLSVHEQLLLRVAALKIPIPTKKATALRDSYKEERILQSIKTGRKKRTLPPFPKKLEILIGKSEIDKRKDELQEYLQAAVNYKFLRNCPELTKFLEVSAVSFVSCLGNKRKEGVVWKRSGGRHVFTGCLDFVNCITDRWRNRWLFVKDTFVAYMDLSTYRIGDVILVDNKFKLTFGLVDTGQSAGIIVSNRNRKLICACPSVCRMLEWVESISLVIETTGTEFMQANKHDSFAPFRQETNCKWFIDGERYMNAVCNAMEQAKEEIYIADWWLSPEIYMKRPATDNYWRLDYILRRKAEDGVLIFVLLFKEIELALNINSRYSKSVLSKLHPNIQVLRHPDHLRRRVLLWSHHEKLVIIDQKICFLGGMDLCFGRWDTPTHPINDETECSIQYGSSPPLTTGLDLSMHQSRLLNDTIHGADYDTEFLIRQRFGQNYSTRLWPGKEKSKSSFLRANPLFNEHPILTNSSNIQRLSNNNSIEFMSHLKDSTIKSLDDEVEYHLLGINRCILQTNKIQCRGSRKERNVNNSILSSPNEERIPRTLYRGKDYVNWIVKDCSELDKPHLDSIDRESVPRMPWHDIGCEVFGRAARDVARHFIQRWNAVKKEKENKKLNYNILLPKGYTHSEIHKISVINTMLCTCQVLRSVSEWSANIDSTENSILNAYIDTIKKAKHYIYIENQFFITAITDSSETVKNQIGKEIFLRIVHFHKKSKLFRVYIILPLLPAFESNIQAKKGSSLYTVLHYNYKSLFRGSDSLFGRLRSLNIDPHQYIFIGSLRNHGFIHEKLFTEQIYVHSKLLIVDDLYSIIGSANLNDRSMLGNRDSEVALFFKDEQLKKGTFNGAKVKVGNFSSSLRKALMAEHLGVETDGDYKSFFDVDLLNDPVQDSFFRAIWCSTAQNNTQLFEEIFSCLPSNKFKKFSSFSGYKNEALLTLDPELAKKKVRLIRGHLVMYPIEFLMKESLEPALATRERLMPVDLWL